MKRLIVSFSGGKTSAYMAYKIQQECSDQYDIKYVFANTGQEHEKTLEFIHRCEVNFGLDIVWLEAVVDKTKNVGTMFKVVDYRSASRNGEPFEDVIEKYGIPNKSYPHCNRELKLAPINSWVKSIGWDDRYMAIGIRADEIDRMSIHADKNRIVYPLISWFPTMKYEISAWWDKQDFNLEIPERLGNCTWCWKKSFKKHNENIKNNPEIYDFPKRMERDHGLSGHNVDGTKRVFFRGNVSVLDLEAGNYDQYDNLDNGCSSQCDVFTEQTDMFL